MGLHSKMQKLILEIGSNNNKLKQVSLNLNRINLDAANDVYPKKLPSSPLLSFYKKYTWNLTIWFSYRPQSFIGKKM